MLFVLKIKGNFKKRKNQFKRVKYFLYTGIDRYNVINVNKYSRTNFYINL